VDVSISFGGDERKEQLSSSVSVEARISAVVQKDVRVAKRGFLKAVERLETAVAEGPDGADDVYISIAEAADWLDSLSAHTDISSNVDAQAVLFARHRTHHQMASIAYFDENSDTHVWRPVTQLPEPEEVQHRGDKIKPFYSKRLAGKPVLEVFTRLKPVVASAHVKPPR
jgi:hypothetical protein